MKWYMITFILCVFGALKEYRPSEPFVSNYLNGTWKNFTSTQVNQEIYPIGTYCQLGLLILVFLFTDFVRYKPAIILCGISGICTYILLRYGTTMFHMQIVQFLYAMMMSTEVAYYTYIYAKVDKEHYQKVTGFTRGALLLGRFVAGSSGQVITSYGLLDYEQLNYLTLGAYVLATIWACFLPSVNQSIYFNRSKTTANPSISLNNFNDSNAQCTKENQENAHQSVNESRPSFCTNICRAFNLLWKDCIEAYTNVYVVKWSLWWAFATCCYFQVVNNAQLLWLNAISAQNLPNDTKMYNGAVEALYTIISAVIVLLIGQLPLNWELVGVPILSAFSIIEGLLLLISCYTYNMWIIYVLYVSFGVIYHSIVTIANFEVAKHISEDSYALIFGINTFLSLLFQSILTFIVIGSLKLDILTQYKVYAGYYLCLGVIFSIMSIITILYYVMNKKSLKIWIKNTACTSKL